MVTRNIVKAVDKGKYNGSWSVLQGLLTIECYFSADVRAIIAKGWSSKGAATPSKEKSEPPSYSDNCYPVDKVPHGWLFPKIKAALHHGGESSAMLSPSPYNSSHLSLSLNAGAGTVGASLTAGLPTLIKPWFGDQFF